MDNFLWFLITLAVAFVGGATLYKLKMPAGAMVGALICVGILSVLTGKAVMPSVIKNITKTIAGLFIGMSMTMKMVMGLKNLIKPAIILVVLVLSLCFGMGVILFYASDMDVVTSLFSVAPGGMMDMTLMTIDMGGDAAVVAVLQSLRLISVYCISMPLAKVLTRKLGRGDVEHTVVNTAIGSDKDERKKKIIFSSVVALVGGAFGYMLNLIFEFSVLVLIGSMAVSSRRSA